MKIVPVTQRAMRAWVQEHHRHLPAPRGDVIRCAVATDDGKIVGMACAGRPSARGYDDGQTLEVTRVAVLPGYPNACSALYGALRRAGRALGWERFVTYTLPEEGGASLRASGWREAGQTNGGEWACSVRARKPAARPEPKTRWLWP